MNGQRLNIGEGMLPPSPPPGFIIKLADQLNRIRVAEKLESAPERCRFPLPLTHEPPVFLRLHTPAH